MHKRSFWITVVCLFLLIGLAACGAESIETESAPEEAGQEAAEEEVIGDLEATGSESDGSGIFPTPITGAKVSPTRASSGPAVSDTIQADIFFVGQTPHLAATNLGAIAAWFTNQPAISTPQFGLSLFGNTGSDTIVALTPEVTALTAVLTQTLTGTSQTILVEEAFSQAVALPGWRTTSQAQVIFLIVDSAASIDSEALTTALNTAVTPSLQVIPILIGEAETEAVWQQLAETTNGRVITLSNSETLGSDLTEAIINTSTEILIDLNS